MADSDETPDATAGQESAPERVIRLAQEFREMRAEHPDSKAFVDALIKSYGQEGLTIEDVMADIEAMRDVATAWQLRLEFELAKRGKL